MRLHWLPSVLRAAGLTVHEQPGWQTRGYEPYDPYGLIVHATAGNLSPESDIRVLLTGSATAPPPISQLFLARSGEWWVIASGRCNHALTGWAGLLKGYGNTRLIGIEAANDNRGEPWRPQQYDSYVRGVAAICKHLGWDPSRRVSGHKEHQPAGYPGKTSTKTDPTFDMATFRSRVQQSLTSGDFLMSLTDQQQADMLRMVSNLDRELTANLLDQMDVTGLNGDQTYPNNPLRRLDRIEKAVDELAARPPVTVELTPEALAALGPAVEAAVARALERVRVEVPPAA